MKLIQKQFLKGSREFEIVDDVVFVRIKGLLKEQQLTVSLSSLDPEPGIEGGEMVFYSQQHHRPVLSLLLNQPAEDKFNGFVAALKQGAMGDGVLPVIPDAGTPLAPGWNVYEEPPSFEDFNPSAEKAVFEPLVPARVEMDINMLKTYLDPAEIQPLLDCLELLKSEPDNEAAFQKMMDTYNQLGPQQGAVLTYAPYLKVLLSEYIW